ncbi:MAG: hypothetical protein IJU68_02940 [Bacteroidales bacterium]|nr:hypothetical protein [Bacteroidales bacterium]
MKHIITVAAAVLLLASCNTPQRPRPELMFRLIDFEEIEHSRNVQGCAVYGDLLFSLQDKGWCNVFDLEGKELEAQFPLGSQGRNNHANIAFFGPQRYDESDRFPLMYVSQCKSKPVTEIGLAETDSLSRLLFVERILTDENGTPFGSELVQIINYEPAQWNSRLWIADTKQPDLIWCYGNIVGNEKPGNRIVLKSFAFPEFSPDRFLVNLTDNEVKDSLYFDELLPEGARGPQNAILQGAAIIDGILYLPCGVGSKKHPSEVFYAGLRRHKGKYGAFDFTDVLPWEPEDFDLWGDRIICPCNTDSSGFVYSFPYRDFVRSMTRK